MKLYANIDGDQVEIQLSVNGDKVVATVDSREYELDLDRTSDHSYLLKSEKKVFEVWLSNSDTGQLYVSVGDQDFSIDVSDPKRLRASTSGAATADGPSEIRTAMPGKIVRLLKEKGDDVAAGEAVVVVEAMKMQNELASPRDGKVAEIRCQEGSTVEAGVVLAVISD